MTEEGAGFYRMDLPPQILTRGFWLYALKIIGPGDEQYCYVGLTGRTPLRRAGEDFEPGQIIRQYLDGGPFRPAPEKCSSVALLIYGPIAPSLPWLSVSEQIMTGQSSKYDADDYNRDRVMAVEQQLWIAARSANYTMINKLPGSRLGVDRPLWGAVHSVFAADLGLGELEAEA